MTAGEMAYTQEEERSLFRLAVSRWGVEAQWRMLQEECAELIAAINRADRQRCEVNDLVEELADVAIMLGQAAEMVGLDRCRAAKQRKLERLEQRLDGTD